MLQAGRKRSSSLYEEGCADGILVRLVESGDNLFLQLYKDKK